MAGYIAYLASLIVFTFGALTFTVLALSYWRERRPRGDRVFPAFTLVCAVAFVSNLAAQLAPDTGAMTVLMLLRALATGILPAILLHLMWGTGQAVVVFYGVCALAALAHALSAMELAAVAESDLLDAAPGAMLGVACALGLARDRLSEGRAEAVWNRVLFGLILIVSGATITWPDSFLSLVPDYLVLAFFCVTLYYKERLVFFDLLIKRGAYFAVSVLLLTAFFALAPRRVEPWIAALLLAPLWLIGPWLDRRLGNAIDRLWLRRRYSSAEAERLFVSAVQLATSEADLVARAEQALGNIFQTTAEVQFRESVLISLRPRPDSIPFMSDDHRLLESLRLTLSVVLENVRFRDREQQLRLLASRAELRALRAQINPHFLFNALNAIAGLIQEQPALADETVEQLAQVFRYTLRKSESEWVRLEEEIEFVKSYLRVEQARFGRRLRVELEVDPSAAMIPVPAMTIQPLIENAIKHGASAVEGPATVGLRAGIAGRMLSVEVSDNGPGFPPGFSLEARPGEQPDRHGLRNIAERLKGYYGDAARLSWRSENGVNRVSLEIPLAAAAETIQRNVRVASADSR